MKKNIISILIFSSTILNLIGCASNSISTHRIPAECNTQTCSTESCQISKPADYALVFSNKTLSNCPSVHGLFGRVLRGRTKNDFDNLSDDPNRKIIFLMDTQGLQSIRGLSTPEILKQIGYTPEYIQNLVEKHYQFKLVVFKEFPEAMPATWENVLVLINQIYPLEIGSMIANQLPNLKTINFGEIEAQAPSKFKEIHELGPSNSDYIDDNRLLASKGELWKVRAFLYNQLRLTELFSGNGYTQLSDGTHGAPEFIILNKAVNKLPDVKVIDLN
ncbi:MAG: hypothetical protein ACXVCA_09510 [Bdellovibrio sp.]